MRLCKAWDEQNNSLHKNEITRNGKFTRMIPTPPTHPPLSDFDTSKLYHSCPMLRKVQIGIMYKTSEKTKSTLKTLPGHP